MHDSLSLVVHGDSGVGKSWLADTAPKPLLLLDAEGGARFTPSNKVTWDGISAPPTYDGTWDTCVVVTRNFQQVKTVFQWLNSGQHQFRSVAVDSLTEVQKRCVDEVAGVDQMTQQDWGALLRQMEALVRQFRDLTMHPTRPLDSVVFVCLTSYRDGKYTPHLQGQLRVSLPYFVDVVGYLYVQADPTTGQPVRRMLVQPTNEFVAKDRTDRLGTNVEAPNVQRMIEQIFGTNGQQPVADYAQQPGAYQEGQEQQAQAQAQGGFTVANQ